jgi:predicted RecB family nuclease
LFLPRNGTNSLGRPRSNRAVCPDSICVPQQAQPGDKLLLAFDARVLSGVVGREVGLGKIVHGENYATLKVKTSAPASDVRELTGKIDTLVASPVPPDLVLNRHCAECEFQNRCRQKAVEKDDLSLLSGMTEKERTNFNSKGIFTVSRTGISDTADLCSYSPSASSIFSLERNHTV